MIDNQGNSELASVVVMTTHNRGFSPEEVAERALLKLIGISDTAPPAIAEQARAFRDSIRTVLVYYMHEAIRADRVTLTHKLNNAGHSELVKLLDL